MKRILLSLFAVVFVFGTAFTGTSQAASSDYPWAQEAAEYLANHNILRGFPGGDYKLGQEVTRAQFAAYVVRSLNLEEMNLENPFTDVDPDRWYYQVVYKAAAAGIVNGYPDGTFRPNRKISRQEMAVMINRMLKYKGIVTEIGPLTFADKEKIGDWAKEAVKRSVSLGIIEGYPETHTFQPEDNAKRADSVVVIYRALTDVIHQSDSMYSVGTISNGEIQVGNSYWSFSTAKSHANRSNEVVLKGKTKVVWMRDGIAYTSGFTEFGNTYVPSGTELKFLGADKNSVKISIAGVEASVSPDEVVLVPTALKEGQSYYSAEDNVLVHHIFQPITGDYASYSYGYAPNFMKAGQKYYSWDGNTFYSNPGTTNKVGTAYQYFNILPLNTKTSYTAEQLNQYVKENIPKTYDQQVSGAGPLATLGDAFIKAQNEYGVNAMYLLAHAIHESAWGTSDIAQDKNNLYGLDAIDGAAYENADVFKSFAACIDNAAKYISRTYHNPNDWRYFGAMLGNKGAGMNVKYASDPFWGQKIAGYMYRIDKALGGKAFNRFNLGVATSTSLNVRSVPHTGEGLVYQFPNNREGAGFIILGKEQNGDGTWYKIYSDESDFRNWEKVYTYHDGQYDLLSKEVNIAD